MLGIDLGSRRIGVAVSDPGGVLASPVTVLARSGDPAADHRAIAALAAEWGAGRIVVGLPLSLDGSMGPAARAAADEAEALAAVAGVPVEVADERLTTVTADRAMRQAAPKRGARDRRRTIDAAAAAVLLQTWLDGRR